jgi:uncharacterized membrane protein YccF (DUF307 family)
MNHRLIPVFLLTLALLLTTLVPVALATLTIPIKRTTQVRGTGSIITYSNENPVKVKVVARRAAMKNTRASEGVLR